MQVRHAPATCGNDHRSLGNPAGGSRDWRICAGLRATYWAGVGAPRNTPVEIIQRLNQEVNAGLADPKLKARFAEMGGTTLPGSPADLGKLIADETEKWGKVVKFAGAKPD